MDDMIPSPSVKAKLVLQNKISGHRPTSSDQNLAMSYAIETPTSQLWLSSRRDSSDATRYTAPGEDRILSYTNLKLALNLVPLLWSRFALLFWQGGHRARLLAFALSKILKGFLPAAKIWASSALLDEVQASFGASKEEDVDQGKIIRLAVSSLIISAGNSILDFLSTNNNVIVKHHVDHQVERLYMSSQLSLDIPTLSDPTVSALIYEAGCFAGFESRTSRPGMGSSMTGRIRSRPGAFSTLSQLLNSITLSVEVATASALLFRTLSTALEQMQTQAHERDRDAVSLLFGISTKSVILLVLCFLPSVLSLSGTLFSLSVPLRPKGKLASPGKLKNNPGISESESHARRETGYEVQHMKVLGKNGAYKQEVVLFGLKEWILTKWEGLVNLQMETEMAHRGRLGWMLVSFRVSEEAVQTAFLALLALRSFGTSISLGSIRLYQSTASSLLGSLRSLTRSLQQSVQSLFYMAAFFEAIDMTAILEEKGRRALKVSSGNIVDYETTRLSGGMRIEARNLGFTYPGQQEPVLRDINLVVEPGSTVAIVGLNGGGKTTLVKVLMGLYDHTGDLLINGHPAEAFPSKQLHARTTCCFQDHGKYRLTLQENIGIGNVDLIDSRVDIDRAIVKGGAESVRDRVGLGGKLDDVGVPKVLNETVTKDVWKADDAETRPSDDKPGTSASLRLRGRGKGSTAGSDVGKDTPASSAFQRTSLSGGQWQRVALARAFLRADDADLVVFDEPSASLDPQAEQALFKRVHALSSGEDGKRTTTIFISHRIQTVRRADKIVVVENGTIIESGPHDALMAMKGRYAEFFNLQREGFD